MKNLFLKYVWKNAVYVNFSFIILAVYIKKNIF